MVQGAGSNTRDSGILTLKGLFVVFKLPLFHIWLKYTKYFTHKLVVSCKSVAKEKKEKLKSPAVFLVSKHSSLKLRKDYRAVLPPADFPGLRDQSLKASGSRPVIK